MMQRRARPPTDLSTPTQNARPAILGQRSLSSNVILESSLRSSPTDPSSLAVNNARILPRVQRRTRKPGPISRYRPFSCDQCANSRIKWMLLFVTAGIAIAEWTIVVLWIKSRTKTPGVSPFDAKRALSTFSAPAGAAHWVVFYNIYISPDPLLSRLGLLLVEEQLGQVGTSYAASAGDLTVYYTSIGDILDTEWLESLCSIKYNMTCLQTAHYSAGDEMLTLAKLHEYCHHHPDQSVVYLHNKGSLHPGNMGQDRWRRTMTAAATSKLCVEPLDAQCNACGMLFQPLPANHFPGNMWTSPCSYINRLLSPAEYHVRRAGVDEWIKTQVELGLFSQNGGLFPMESHYTGKGRYEAEHWLGGHPDLRPCDVSQEPYKDYWLVGDRDVSTEFQFAMAPRHDITAGWIWYSHTSNNATLMDPAMRKRDFFLLRGMIYRWVSYYGEVPDADSWIWQWFPDGDTWKASVEKLGGLVAVNAIENLPGAAVIANPNPSRRQSVWGDISATMYYLKTWMYRKETGTMSVRKRG